MGTNKKRRLRTARQLVMIALVIGAAIYGYRTYSASMRQAGFIKAAFHAADGKRLGTFSLEVAANEGARHKGLMYRRVGDIAPDQGMIFVFPDEIEHSFYMKNTMVPLDMIFVDGTMKVVGVIADVPILSETPRSVNVPSRYVVELLAGTAKRSGIVPGSVLKPEAALPIPY